MIIYLDVIFIENFIINYFLIYITSKVIHVKCEMIYFIISAIMASMYTIVAIIYPLDLYKTFLFKLLLAICMIKIAYRPLKIRYLIKYTIAFYIVTFNFGGIILTEVSKNANYFQMLLAIIAGTMLLTISWKMYKEKIRKENSICNIILELNGELYKIKAFIDTGHNLKETITGDDVIIISKKTFESFVPTNIVELLDGKIFDIPNEYQSKIRLITYKTIGNKDNVTCGIKIDNVKIYHEGKTIENNNAIIVKEEKEFNGYEALISLDLLEGGYVYGNNVAYKIKSKKVIC